MRDAAAAPPPSATALVPPPALAPSNGSAIVAMERVTRRFGEAVAVRDLTFSVPEGGLVGVIGPSGCGKTTAVRLLLGIYEPSEGECRVFGQPSHRLDRATRARLGYLPQHFVLYPNLTVDENLNFAASLYGLGPFRRRAQKRRVLELVNLVPHRRKLAADLSGGMQRRLALAATLLHQPDLILLDEPTAGIDPLLREQLWAEFRRLQQAGHTQIVTTQYVGEAEYCDTVLLMDRGEIIACDTPENLRRAASGGELLDVTIDNFTPAMYQHLRAFPGVRGITLAAPDTVRLSVEDAGAMLPGVLASLQAQGIAVRSIEEHRQTFNEVFIALLGQANRRASEVSYAE